MRITTEKGQDATVVRAAGSLNTNTAPELEQAVNTVFEEGAQSIVFDFEELEYLSSAGLRVLMAAYKQAVAAGGNLRISGANEDIREVFDITGLSDLFQFE